LMLLLSIRIFPKKSLQRHSDQTQGQCSVKQ
jgi:OAH_OAS_sulfhy: O-acetylhomoserine aminocarboxypropyltransferase/cysteine synthase